MVFIFIFICFIQYPGVKKVKSIKGDVYSITLIPPNRQVWTGWPSNVGDEKALYELETPSFTLDLTVDDNRPRPSRPRW